MSAWTSDTRTADAIEATVGLTREQLTARLTFLAPALTDEALRSVVVAAMTAPKRLLDSRTLAEEQRAREATP